MTVSVLLVLSVLVVAAAAGFLGAVLQLVAAFIVVLSVVGALAGGALWILLKRMLAR
jgi:hypothetical protein